MLACKDLALDCGVSGYCCVVQGNFLHDAALFSQCAADALLVAAALPLHSNCCHHRLRLRMAAAFVDFKLKCSLGMSVLGVIFRQVGMADGSNMLYIALILR